MCFHDLPHEREAKTRSAVTPCRRSIELMEGFKDVIDFVGWDSNASISDGNHDKVFPFTFYGCNHASTRRRKFNPVVDQLTQHPSDLLRIGLQERNILIHYRVQVNTAFERLFTAEFDRQICEPTDVHI